MSTSTQKTATDSQRWAPDHDPDVAELRAQIETFERKQAAMQSRLNAQQQATQRARSLHVDAKRGYDAAFEKWRREGQGEADLDVLKVRMDDAASALALEDTKRAALATDCEEIDKRLRELNAECDKLCYSVRQGRKQALIDEWLSSIVSKANETARRMVDEGLMSRNPRRRFEFIFDTVGYGNHGFEQARNALDHSEWPDNENSNSDDEGELA